MKQRFLGIDFGWEGKPTGLCALEFDNAALRLIDLRTESAQDDILSWADRHATPSTVIGVDAPIVIPNETGMRDADKLAHRHYGKYHAGAYPASRARNYWRRTTGLSLQLEAQGFRHGDRLAARAPGRYQIEVHPHAATVQLFRLDRIVKYKRGNLAGRRAGLGRLRSLLSQHLPRLLPPLALPGLPEIPDRGPALKNLEDRLDAITSAYVAAHYWFWGPARNEVHGDAEKGYIVVPKRQPELSPIAHLRESYTLAGLDESDLHPSPIAQFEEWFQQAREAGIKEPNAMTLATATPGGAPSARIVLLKGLSEEGFVFYTNYESQKGRELTDNPRAALIFYWPDLERQVRITGSVTRVSREESEAYFHSRPIGSQLGALASRQTEVIPSRLVLEERIQSLQTEYQDREIPLPDYWGGFRLKPETVEFWQGRPSRLHDRLRYTRNGQTWLIDRLSP